MTITFEIEDCLILVESDKTKQFYLTQEKITDDCQCNNCKFYVEDFTKEALEIFSILSSMGVDLEKNLNSEPTGVWCIRDENVSFLHCNQIYQAVGQFLNNDNKKLRYEKEEKGYITSALIVQFNSDTIKIQLTIDKV